MREKLHVCIKDIVHQVVKTKYILYPNCQKLPKNPQLFWFNISLMLNLIMNNQKNSTIIIEYYVLS